MTVRTHKVRSFVLVWPKGGTLGMRLVRRLGLPALYRKTDWADHRPVRQSYVWRSWQR